MSAKHAYSSPQTLNGEGNLILLAQELAEQERQRAEQAESTLEELRNRLQQMGIDPDQVE